MSLERIIAFKVGQRETTERKSKRKSCYTHTRFYFIMKIVNHSVFTKVIIANAVDKSIEFFIIFVAYSSNTAIDVE